MSFLLSPSLTDVLFSVGLGYVGISGYLSWKAGGLSFVDPMTYMALLKADPIPSLLPMLGSYLGYMYGAGSGNLIYLYAIGGAMVGQMLAPNLRSGN
jgi:hypothetical protein